MRSFYFELLDDLFNAINERTRNGQRFVVA